MEENIRILLNEYDLINEYERFFSQNCNRVRGKMSEYEGKRIGLSKRVYSFNRYLRVLSKNVNFESEI